MKSKISEDLGRLFEVGFNIGILAYIQQHQLTNNFGDLYRRDLEHLKLPKMFNELISRASVISTEERKIVDNWTHFLLLKGFLAGLNFFREYIKSLGLNEPQKPNLKILYYQCSFSTDNSIGTYNKAESEFRELLSQFSHLKQDDIDRYIRQHSKKTGEFLQADTLMLLQYRNDFRILSVDLSVFSPKLADDAVDLDEIEEMRRLLLREISYLRSKSVFSKLRIDTGSTNNNSFSFSEGLKRHLTAFSYKDKESYKLIQAASYSHSFYQFLRNIGIFTQDTSVAFNVVGYSNRGISAMSLRQENLDFLETCSQIYKNKPKDQDINYARGEVLKFIKLNAAKSFSNGSDFVKRLLEIPGDTTTIVSHTERIEDFSSTLNLRQPHAELIKDALVSDNTYIFLTGNPGIGKTTAIVEFLKERVDEGFLFFYVSPRKQVNLDIIEKFKDTATELFDERLFCINTNSQLIKDNFPRCTVNYHSNQRQGDFTEKSVTFLDAIAKIERRERRQQQVKRITEDQLQAASNRTRGVLSSLCEAIYTVIDGQISNNLVATACIQSLRITQNGKNTLSHFENIFKGAVNKREGTVIPSKMRAISQRIKHLFIMIDEITGDDGGVEFLNGISTILGRYELIGSRHGFNTKVIVADASIVDPDVIGQHLAETSPEPDKIFFRKASKEAASPLSVQPFEFKSSNATVINANSYPARSLAITYKVIVESVKFSEETFSSKKDSLKKSVQAQIIQDINAIWKRPDAGQILVYIQDKRRLQELITQIKNQRGEFEKNKDYLEVHASISDNEKTEIQQYKNTVKVVFMTSSASRGLSFPKAKHILVEIPRFRVESNLMEVIQVIYRGRGEYDENGVRKTLDDRDKELVFYLCDRAVYYADDTLQTSVSPSLHLQESVISLLNILLILKTSVMTRIKGSGQLGRENFLIIPIGGKSVSAAGQTFSGQIANLIKELKNEHNRRHSDKLLEEVYISLEQLLSRAEFVLNTQDLRNRPPTPPNLGGTNRNPVSSRNRVSGNISYLRLRESLNREFSQLCSSLDKLLNFGNIEPGLITGSLLVVPIANQKLEETYEIRLIELATHATQELLNKMRAISHSPNYPENLRSGIKGAIELIIKLREPMNRTQWFEQNSQHLDQYYALPLFTFLAGDKISEYFSSDRSEPTDARFRDILATYIHHLYPAEKTLPIGHKYRDFPFVVFRSYSLEDMREKIFTDKYLLTSNELNILNLILSKES